MKEIKLSQQGKNKNKFIALVDDDMFDYLNQWRWHVCILRKSDIHYAVSYIQLSGQKKKRIFMHRMIMNCPDGMEVDHIDHNGLNDQKSNLRICTTSQNKENVKAHGRSQYLGVCIRRTGRISSQISRNKKIVYIGSYNTEEEAA